jgi:hypothetical protein
LEILSDRNVRDVKFVTEVLNGYVPLLVQLVQDIATPFGRIKRGHGTTQVAEIQFTQLISKAWQGSENAG